MRLKVKFKEIDNTFKANFGEVHNISDGGYERGYETGYTKGNTDGYKMGFEQGYDEGLSKRTYEVWTITLVDGSMVEKEVALL